MVMTGIWRAMEADDGRSVIGSNGKYHEPFLCFFDPTCHGIMIVFDELLAMRYPFFNFFRYLLFSGSNTQPGPGVVKQGDHSLEG